MRNVLLLLETSTTGNGLLFFERAEQLGLKPVLVSTTPSVFQDVAKYDSLTVRSMKVEAIVDAVDVFGRERIAGVCSPLSQWAELVALVARALERPHCNPEAVAICRDKFRTREVLGGAGIHDVAFRSAFSGVEAEKAAAALGGVLIVKPREASGAFGVRICNSPPEVRAHVDDFVVKMPSFAQFGISIEEYIEGPQFGIEMFDLQPLAVRRKHISPPPSSIPIGLDCPPLEDAEVCRAVVEHAIRATRATGYVRGPAHVEVRFGAKGPCIIEINPRLVGGVGAENVRRYCGVDMIDATIRFAAGMEYSLDKKFERASVTRYLLRDGIVPKAVLGREEAMAVPGVVEVGIFPGGMFRRGPTQNYMDRIAYVISEAATSADAIASADKALGRLRMIPESRLSRTVRRVKKKVDRLRA